MSDPKEKFSLLPIYSLLAISLLFMTLGCNSESKTPDAPSNYLFYERYYAPEVIAYIEKYGNDYQKTQSIEAGKVFETMTWRSKGISIKYLYETGQIVEEKKFSTYSSTGIPVQ